MSSKFSRRQRIQPTPKICKAVGDSFRFVSVPTKNPMLAWISGEITNVVPTWEINGWTPITATAPVSTVWKADFGESAATHAEITVTYNAAAATIEIEVIAMQATFPLLTRRATINDVDPKKPFTMSQIRLTPETQNDTIYAQVLY